MRLLPRLFVATCVVANLALAHSLSAQVPQPPLDGLSGREHWTIYNALVHVMQGDRGYEAVVHLTANRMSSWTPVPAQQFMTYGAEFGTMSGLVLKDERVRIRRRLVGLPAASSPGGVPGFATYFNPMVVTANGQPRERVRAACLFERSAGDMEWRHGRVRGSMIDTRRKRDLLLRMFMIAGNYDYLFDWVFQQDGTLRMDAGATGMDATKTATGTPA